jgi:hypothetical protein
MEGLQLTALEDFFVLKTAELGSRDSISRAPRQEGATQPSQPSSHASRGGGAESCGVVATARGARSRSCFTWALLFQVSVFLDDELIAPNLRLSHQEFLITVKKSAFRVTTGSGQRPGPDARPDKRLDFPGQRCKTPVQGVVTANSSCPGRQCPVGGWSPSFSAKPSPRGAPMGQPQITYQGKLPQRPIDNLTRRRLEPLGFIYYY